MGRAGILPAAVGMLPTTFGPRLTSFWELIGVESVRQNAGHCEQTPPAPQSNYTMP
jgi:hypothetical protein